MTIKRHADIDPVAFSMWVASMPEKVQVLIKSHPPDVVYRNNKTGQMMIVQAYSENGTLRAEVVAECAGLFSGGASVFGLDPTDLVPATEEEYDARRAMS